MKKSTADQKQESKELEAEMARQTGRAQQRTRSRAGLREGGAARVIILEAIPPRIFLTHTPGHSCVCSLGHRTILEGTENHNLKGPITPLSTQQAQHPMQ